MFETLVEFCYNLQADLNTDYVFRSCFVAAIFGILFFSIFLVISIKTKQSRFIGIITAVLQLVGAMASVWLVVSFHKAELYNVFYELTLDEPDMTRFFIDLLGFGVFRMFLNTIPSGVASILCTISWLSAFIYINRIKPYCSRRLSSASLIIHILRLILASPIPFFFAFKSGGITQPLQEQYDLVYYAVCLLPYIVVLISAMVGNKDNPDEEYGDFSFDGFENRNKTDDEYDNVVVTVEGEEINK